MTREQLAHEFCTMCREDGMEPDKDKIRKTFERYSISEIERFLEACARFGAKAIIECKL